MSTADPLAAAFRIPRMEIRSVHHSGRFNEYWDGAPNYEPMHFGHPRIS